MLNYRVVRSTSSVTKRLGPPAAKLFEKVQPKEQINTKKDIFSRLGKEVPKVRVRNNYHLSIKL